MLWSSLPMRYLPRRADGSPCRVGKSYDLWLVFARAAAEQGAVWPLWCLANERLSKRLLGRWRRMSQPCHDGERRSAQVQGIEQNRPEEEEMRRDAMIFYMAW